MSYAKVVQAVTGKDPNWIARYAFPEGSEIMCPKCKARRHAATSEIAEFMEKGFPICRNCKVHVRIENGRYP